MLSLHSDLACGTISTVCITLPCVRPSTNLGYFQLLFILSLFLLLRFINCMENPMENFKLKGQISLDIYMFIFYFLTVASNSLYFLKNMIY